MVIAAETLLYFCFSILIGGMILLFVIPEQNRPTIHIPKLVILGAILGIVLLSFAPILRLLLFLYPDIGVGLTLQSILFTFQIGQAWLVTSLVSIPLFLVVLFYYPKMKNNGSILALFFSFILILTLGWASHGASLSSSLGFYAHCAHFLAVSIWVGILLIVSWFSQDYKHWSSFLAWFHPVALVCLAVTFITGLMLMYVIGLFDQYTSSWLIAYGQALLIKHIFIIPLIAYACINGVLMKKKLRENPAFNPLPWTRVESVILFFIFAATATIGQQAPPHDLENLLIMEGPAWLFSVFYQGSFEPTMSVSLGISGLGILLALLALLFLSLLVFSFVKQVSAYISLLMSILFVLTSYTAIMVSIQ